jgi:hypothetical protein
VTPPPSTHRVGWGLAVAVLLLGALGLRLWGLPNGLPFVYNIDENSHFVPKAVALFGTDGNPHYFVNPPLLTYVLHFVFDAWFGGGDAVKRALATNPTEVFEVARTVVAVLGTAAVGLLYLAGAKLGGRVLGLLAGTLLAVAFLPVFYAHLALNDAPTLAPVALSLWGTAGVLRDGRRRYYVLAGVGLGLAAATKYTGGIVLLPLLGALLVRWRAEEEGRAVLVGVAVAAGTAILAFLVGNPFALFDTSAFRDGLTHQSDATGSELGKLGAPRDGGLRYYAWTLSWGLGWVPALAALGGAIFACVRDRRAALVLVPAPVLFLIFMSVQTRFFGRWLLPIYPLLCLLAALGALALVGLVAGWLGPKAPGHARQITAVLTVVVGIALGLQGLVHAVHVDRVLSRPDTRALTRDWMVRNLPPHTRIVAEPVSPDAWVRDGGLPAAPGRNRWVKWPVFRTAVQEDGTLGKSRVVGVEDYERTLRPQLLKAYVNSGYCYVVVGSTQRGRAGVRRREVPHALTYYQALEKQGEVVFHAAPWGSAKDRVPFNFDWSFDSYPLAYRNAGPEMTIYKLSGGKCGERGDTVHAPLSSSP